MQAHSSAPARGGGQLAGSVHVLRSDPPRQARTPERTNPHRRSFARAHRNDGACPLEEHMQTRAAQDTTAVGERVVDVEVTPSGTSAELGILFPRYFSRPGVDPFDDVEWELRAAVIGNERGQVVFEQRDVEIPKAWSQQATNIVVSKYFRGQIGTPERERSVKQLIGRVVDTITGWARAQAYFASPEALQAFSHELKHLLVY